MRSKREELGQIVIRPPEGMRERIRVAAEANNRSMNAEIVATLEEKYPEPEVTDTDRAFELANLIVDTSIRIFDADPDEIPGLKTEILNLKRELIEIGGERLIGLIPLSLDQLAELTRRSFEDLCHPDSPLQSRVNAEWRVDREKDHANRQWGNPKGEKMLIAKLEEITGFKYRPIVKK